MRNWIVLGALGVCLLGGAVSAQEVAPAVKKEEANAKAERYHKLLLKRPDSEILFERFVGAWLDTGTKEGLQLFLKEAAEEGGAAEWQLLANYLGYGGEDEAALKALNAAVEKAPKDEALRVTRAKLQARLLNFEGALADLDAAGEKAKDGDDAALRGLYLARSGRPEEAVAAWKEVMKARPRDEELREDLIELEVAEGLYEEALETVDGLLAITKDPYLKALRRLRKGDVLVVSGKREDALKVFEEVLGSTGDNSWLEREVLAQVERVFVREDDVVGLRKFYDQLREAFPRRVSLRKGLAVQMAANGETEEAVKLFREVLKITPGDRRNREEFVDLLEAVEQMDEAVKELRALMGDKGDADLWERMAALQDKRSDEEGVKEALDKVLALKAEDPFGLIATARLFDNYKLDEEAEKILREGRAKFPETIEMTEALATFLAQAQREEEAVALWRELAKDADREGLMRVARSLSANGLRKEAFAMLDVRIEEFGRDPLLLAQYCELAAQTEQAKRAWPYAVALVRTAETSTGLEGALKVSMSMVRSLDQEALIQELKEAKTIGEQCLLSELYEFTGEDNVALEILDAAEKGDEGLMVAAQRVRLLERRGDLDKAADAMRALLARPKGRRPVHIRRLVSLLSAAGKMEAALVEVDGWKRLAPGDRVAWRTRSELLTEMGRIDEAVVELRRAASKFGAEDEEMRSRLAAALVEAGDYREGERIYKKLYEEAEDTGGKLRWIVEMVNLARQEGRQDELVEDFERRKRANPREVTPLLALAEIYNQLEDPLGQKEALAEAVRRRPGDVKLIGDLAKLAEKSGDLEAALKWREEATKRDPGPDSKRRLADYFFRSGEMESGLAQLKGIAAEAEDPRAIEKTLQALAKGGEWEVLLTYAKGLGPVMENDWRLSYIKAVALEEEGAEKEARAMFEAFVSEEKEIAGVKPLLPMKEFREWVQSNRKRGRLGNANVGETIAQYQWNQYQNLAYKHRQNRGSRIGYSSSGATADPVALPGEARELRWMAVGHLVGMSENKSEEERLEFLEKIHAPWLESIDLASYVQTNLVDYFGKKLEKNPEDLRTLARAVQRVGRNKEFGEKWLVLASEKLKEDWPMAAMEARFTLIQRSTEDVGEQASELLKLFENVDEQLESYALGRLAELAFGSSSAMKPEDKARVAGRIETYLTKVEDEFWMQNWWLVNYLKYRLSSGEYEKVVVVVNTIEAAAERERKKQGVLLKGSQRSSYRQPTLTMPTFSVSSLSAGIPSMLQQLFRNSNGRVAPKLTERQRELLKALQEGQKATPEAIDYVALSEHVGAIQNDYLRLMLLWQGGKKEEFSVELHKLAAQGDAGAVLMAAGYVTTQEKDLIKAYELLVKARTKPMERAMRTQMDSYIALIGSRLATQKETKGKVVVEEAKRAAMRLRRGFRDPAQVQQLAQVMGTLGMKEEMDRLLNPRSTRVRIGGASQYSSRSYRRRGAGIAKYLGLGNRKAAAMEAIKEARTYMSNQHSEYELREIVELIIGAQLGDEMLTLMNPGETKSVSRRLTYARMCSLLKKDEEALRVLRKLAEERPNDVAVQGQLAAVLPSDERQAAVRALLAKDALAGLHLAPGEDVKEAVIAELKREAKRLSELPETQMQGLGVVVRKWIPEMKIEGADKDTSALLVTLSKERKDGPIDLAKMWLENGFTDNRGNLRERVAYAAAELTKSDVKLANELWVAYLDHVRELAITGRGGTSSSGGFIIDPGDYAMNELFEGIVRKKVPAADWLQLLVALEGTEHGKTLGLGYNSYYSSQVVEQALSGLTSGQQMNEGNLYGVKKQWEAYPDLLGKDASAQVRGMAACYLATYYFERGNLRSPEKVLAWLEESKMLERRPIFGKVYRLIAISRIAQDGRSEAHKKEAIRLAAELFVNEEISARFRMMVAQWIASRSDHQWILNSEVSITAMVKLMDDYNNGRRAVVSTHMAGILGTLSKSDEGLSEEHAKHILKVFEPALFGPLAMRYYSGGRGREVFARPMMVMAIRAKDAPAAKRMAQIGGEAIKGDLALLLQLADHGEEELVRRLLAPPGALYIENAGGFDGELEKSWKNLREMVPEEKRFRIDCLLAGLSDSKEWKEGDGEKRADRLLALAKRFEKEAPAIRIARLQCMGAIANENAASEILEEHFAKETQRWMYGQGISQNRQPRELAAAQRIILQAMRMSGEKGEVALLKKQIMPLLDLAASDNYRSYQAMQLLGNMERAAIVSLLKGVGNNPDKVAEALPYTKEFLEKCLRSKRSHSGALVQLAVAQAVLVHALAGQGADYDKMVETFTPTMKTKYDEIRKAGIQNYLGMIGSRDSGRDWKHEDHAKVRVALLRALLMDEPTTKREFKNLNYVFRLAENGTFAYDDIAAAIKEMPSDRPEWKAFSGDLAMLLRLAELGEKEMIGKLLDSENGFYRTNALGSYNEKLQEKTEKLLALVEEDRRYRIEVLIAKCRNAKEYTEKHEGQDFKLRLKKLAEEFDKRAAESGPEVEQCLEAFADSEETLEILGGAYIKVAQGFDFPLGTGGNHQPTGREKAQQRIFRKAMLFEGINGSSERALKRMHSLIEIAKGEDKDAKKRALNGLHELSVSAARGYIFGMAANPDEKRLAEADQLLDELLALEGATKRSRQTAEVMAVIGYALCGKRAEFQKELESWPGEKKKAWHGARKDSWIKMFNLLNHHYYRSSYRTNERKVILKALLTDPETTTREIVHLSNLSSLMDGGVVQRDEIYEVVLALPEDHPRRAEFLTEVAGIKAWREEKLEEAMALYAQAEREAAARNDEATLSLTRAYHALCLAQVGQDPVAAWEFGSKVVIDDLPERDRAKFRKEIPKWKKAAVKAGKVAPEVKEEAPEKVEE